MPLLGDDKTLKRLGYKKVRSKGKNTYTKDVRVKKIKINEMQSDVQKKRIGGAIKVAKKIGMKIKTKLNERRMKKQLKKAGYDSKATSGSKTLNATILRQKKKEKVKKFINMPDTELRKYSPTYMGKDLKNFKRLGIKNEDEYFNLIEMRKILKKNKGGPVSKFDKGGKVKTKKPKSRLLNPYIDFGKTKEFAKNEKAGAVVKTSKAKVGTTIGKNVDVGLIYDKQKFAKQNFTQKTKKTGVEATVAGKRGRVTFSAGKKSESNPFEGKSSGKFFNVQGRINLRAQGGLSPKQSSQMDVDKDGTISSNDLKLKREGFARGGGIAVRGTKFNGIK